MPVNDGITIPKILLMLSIEKKNLTCTKNSKMQTVDSKLDLNFVRISLESQWGIANKIKDAVIQDAYVFDSSGYFTDPQK